LSGVEAIFSILPSFFSFQVPKLALANHAGSLRHFFPFLPRAANPDWGPRAPPRLGREFFYSITAVVFRVFFPE
jgi:hypothetical protein